MRPQKIKGLPRGIHQQSVPSVHPFTGCQPDLCTPILHDLRATRDMKIRSANFLLTLDDVATQCNRV